MTYTLQEIETLVRTTLDVDAEELPSILIASWAREASHRLERARKDWPFYAHRWTLPLVASTSTYDLTDLGTSESNKVQDVVMLEVDGDRRIDWISREEAQFRYGRSASTGKPRFWRVEGDTLYLYPTPDAVESVTVHGVRKPMRWVDAENGYVPDFPDEMHNMIVNWVLGRAYQQQDDPDMGVMYLDMAEDELNGWVKQYRSTPGDQPLVINGGFGRATGGPVGRLRFPWE